VELVQLSGPLKQHVHFEGPDQGDADDNDTDGLDEVSAEIVEMDLIGTSPSLGEVRLYVHSKIPSLGQIREQVNNTPGVLDIPPFTPAGMADSFFDVFFRIELPDLGQSFFAAQPKRLTGVITHKPPAPCDSYENHDQTPIIDPDGNSTGYFMGTMRLEIACEDDCDWDPGDAYKMHWPQLPDLSNVSASTLRSRATAEDGQFQADFPGARHALRISPTLFQPGVFVAGDAGAGNFFESFAPVGRELRPGGA